jgi:hypothetical protein
MSQEQEKPSKAENGEFIKSIVVFIRKTKPKSTTDFVKAGLFKDRSEGRKILREMADKGIITMERPEKSIKYLYSLPPGNSQSYDSEKAKKPKPKKEVLPPPPIDIEEIPEEEVKKTE